MAGETNTSGLPFWLQAVLIGRRPRRTLARLGIIIGCALAIFLTTSFVLFPIRIEGPSMFPTYQNGQINFLNRLAYLWHEPRRGDIVGIRFSGKHMMYVKRIVGLPGEKIFFSHGNIFINDEVLDEPYLTYPSHHWHSQPKQLGPQEYYVVGDNRSMAMENHDQGATERNRIMGKVLLRSGL